MTTAFIAHAECAKHDMGAHHPECPARLGAIDDQLIASGVGQFLARYEAPVATDVEITRVHPVEYLQAIRAKSPVSGTVHLDPDTAMNPHSLSAALHAAGAGVLATDLVMKGEVENAFCSVRPPGHHATRSRSMGFCIFNNVAIAARHAIHAHGIERVVLRDVVNAFDAVHIPRRYRVKGGDAPWVPLLAEPRTQCFQHLVRAPQRRGGGYRHHGPIWYSGNRLGC